MASTRLLGGLVFALATAILIVRFRARRRRRYVRLRIEAYRADRASAEAVVGMFEALHKRLLRRWWRRLLLGQPTVALEVHHATGQPAGGAAGRDERHPGALRLAEDQALEADSASRLARYVWLAVTCPEGLERMIEAALQSAYPNCRVRPAAQSALVAPALLR